MELKEGVFYQTSYDGTEVAIIDDYPDHLPSFSDELESL